MPMIPMKQDCKVLRPALDTDGNPKLSRSGHPLNEKEFSLKCRFVEGYELVVDRAKGTVNSATVTTKGKYQFDKLADIRYTDTLIYVNELGQEVTGSPKQINVKRLPSGKPMLTEVII
jgi:hypothetical protein